MAIKYRGETFSGYNKPKRTPGKSKKSAVLAKSGSTVRLVRFGDPDMSIKKGQPKRKESFLQDTNAEKRNLFFLRDIGLAKHGHNNFVMTNF